MKTNYSNFISFILICTFVLCSCSSIPERSSVYCINITEVQINFKIDDTIYASYYSNTPIAKSMLEDGQHKIEAFNYKTDELEDEFNFVSNSEENYNYFVNVDGEASFAIINITGLYEGGSILGAVNSKDFKVLFTSYKEKISKFETISYMFLAGEPLPNELSPYVGLNGISYLFPIPYDLKDEEKIIELGLKYLDQ